LKQFPPAPENLTPDIEWFSEFQRKLGEEKEIIRNGKYYGSNKLVPHLFEHKNYVIHYQEPQVSSKTGSGDNQGPSSPQVQAEGMAEALH
jgi:hypothetical protein